MSTADERLKQIQLKVEHAKHHFSNLDHEIKNFLASNPYQIECRNEEEAKQFVCRATKVAAVPTSIALIAGDVIQNLRSALDHLAYQLVCSDTNDSPPNPRGIYFPIAETAQSYEDNKLRKMQGAQQVTIQAIDAITPYKAGNKSLWALEKLNNIEKHRMIITAASAVDGINIGKFVSELTAESRAAMGITIALPDSFIRPAEITPVKAGDMVFGGDEVNAPVNVEFSLRVMLFEPSIGKPHCILRLLDVFRAHVETTIGTLAPHLKDAVQ